MSINPLKHGFRLLHGNFHFHVHRDGSVFVRTVKDKSGFNFDDLKEFRDFVREELEDFVATHPWHRKFTDAEQILSTLNQS